jgi:hypothetical protein
MKVVSILKMGPHRKKEPQDPRQIPREIIAL